MINKNPLIDATDGAIVPTNGLWSNSSARIERQLIDLKYRARKNNIPEPTEIYVHTLTKKHLFDNTEFRSWAQNSNTAPDRVLAGNFIEDLWGYNWHFVGGTWQDSGGTTRDLITQEHAVITPAVGPWLRASRGAELVPREVGVVQDMNAALASLDYFFGPFAYAELKHNPAALAMFMGENWGLHFADPGAIWIPTGIDNEALSGTGEASLT